MKRFLFIALVACVFLSSCISKSNQNDSHLDDGATIIQIPILQDTIIKLSDFCSKVEFIQLESTPELDFDSVNHFSVSTQGDFILSNPSSGILRFDSNGGFLNQIGQQRLWNQWFTYDPFENQVITMDEENHCLLFFSMDGKVVNRSDVNSELGHVLGFDVLDKNHLVFRTCKVVGTGVFMSSDYFFVVTSMDGKSIVKVYDDRDAIKKGPFYVFNFSSRAMDASLIHSEKPTEIYKMTLDTLCPCYRLLFSDKTIPEEWRVHDRESFLELIYTSGIAYCSDFFETDNYFILRMVKGPVRLFVQERKENGQNYSGVLVINDMLGEQLVDESVWVSIGLSFFVQDNTCYFLFDPKYISAEKAKEIKKNRLSEVGGSETEDPSCAIIDEYLRIVDKGNKALIKCTLK